MSSVRAHLVQCVHRRLEGLSIRTVAEHDAIHRAAFHLLCRTRAVSADAIPVDRSGGVGGSEQWEVCVGIVGEAVRLRASVRAVFPWNDAGASRKLLVGSVALLPTINAP